MRQVGLSYLNAYLRRHEACARLAMKWSCLLIFSLFLLPSHETSALQAAQEKDKKKQELKTDKSEKKAPEFMRIRKDGRRIMAMETNVVRYTDSIKYPGTTVDLIGAIHLADPDYYDKLNELFKQYDVLLYEAVKEEGAEIGNGEPPRGGGKIKKDKDMSTDTMVGLSVVSTLQLGMKDMLGLEYQMQGVDYTKKNFVHADMTTKEFNYSMKSRGESFGGMMLKEMGKAMGKKTNPMADLDLMLSVTLGGPIAFRRSVAAQLADQSADEAFADENGESTIITERNKKALKVLDEQLEKGHKKIGIFYGAAHMPDMEKRLKADFYYTRGDVKWLEAWKLRSDKKKKKKAADEK